MVSKVTMNGPTLNQMANFHTCTLTVTEELYHISVYFTIACLKRSVAAAPRLENQNNAAPSYK